MREGQYADKPYFHMCICDVFMSAGAWIRLKFRAQATMPQVLGRSQAQPVKFRILLRFAGDLRRL